MFKSTVKVMFKREQFNKGRITNPYVIKYSCFNRIMHKSVFLLR